MNLLVAQSGGPTAAINATLAGVIKEAASKNEIDQILGARNGVQGIFREEFVNISERLNEKDFLKLLSLTPASALGSCRYKINTKTDEELEKIINIFKKHNIGCFIYIGGNDSMDTVYRLSDYVARKKIEDIKIIGAPKTIDNDLFGIDHTPGFGSAAKYIANVFAELEREVSVYDLQTVFIVEMMGRNAGWLTAAAELVRGRYSNIPYLIYVEERDFEPTDFVEDLKKALESSKHVLVAVCEGIHNKDGVCISDLNKTNIVKDAFGHNQAGGVGKILEGIIKAEIGCKTRAIELNLLQRCASHILSKTDIEESVELGKNAVKLALVESGKMSSLKRVSNSPYKVEYLAVDVKEVANKEKKIPKEWTKRAGVTKEVVEYIKPLIQGELSCEYEDGVAKYIIL